MKEKWPLLPVSIYDFASCHQPLISNQAMLPNLNSTFIVNEDIGHLQKPVTADNFLTETTTQLFSHFTMRDESFKVDAFNQRDNTGVMGRMTDILGRNTSSSRSAIDSTSKNLYGDPLVGSEVEVIPSGGPQKFFPNDVHDIKSVTLKLNNITAEGSGIHADLWSESFVKSYAQTDNYAEMLATLSDGPSYVEADQLGKQMGTCAQRNSCGFV